MSEERGSEQAGAPVEQGSASETEVLAAVERAADPTAEVTEATETAAEAATEAVKPERPEIVALEEPPSAGESTESAEQIFAAHTGQTGVASSAAADEDDLAAALDRTAASPERDGEIRISADHPMAGLYTQTPVPPEMRGNRFGGVMISLLATVVFAAVYAGVIALWQAPHFPPSTFVEEGLLPWILNWSFAAAVISFFIGLVLLVVIVGKAGWWAYVLGGFLVAVFTWAGTTLGNALVAHFGSGSVDWDLLSVAKDYGLIFPVIVAGLVAREATVWFGAWIGARGRKIKKLNADALTEYEASLAEVQAKKP